ncbi:MAG: pyridoxal-phosphate dependent enzyme [Alphaproteobacteria bacterium]|nr:pyridoxal-phosphate dependent enzyme [Alphaproteobacteria bacterium]
MPGPDINTALTLGEFQAAQSRIAGLIRRTPLIPAAPVKIAPAQGLALTLKLECLQVTGSFKARGAISKLRALDPQAAARGIITASGGNHGLAVAYAGHVAGARAVIYLPRTVSAAKVAKLRDWGAEIVVEGDVWDESNRAALARADKEGLAYFHPFADAAVIAGQGTTALEILDQAPDTDTLLVAIGGGGLIAGIAAAAKAVKPGIRIVGIEPVGAPTLHQSVAAGRLVTLERIDTKAVTLAPRRSEQVNLDIIRRDVADIVLVTDDQMRAAARWLWFELGLAAELSGAAAIAALASGAYRPAPGERICAIVCGAGTDGID